MSRQSEQFGLELCVLVHDSCGSDYYLDFLILLLRGNSLHNLQVVNRCHNSTRFQTEEETRKEYDAILNIFLTYQDKLAF
jgi:hypothetical protein